MRCFASGAGRKYRDQGVECHERIRKNLALGSLHQHESGHNCRGTRGCYEVRQLCPYNDTNAMQPHHDLACPRKHDLDHASLETQTGKAGFEMRESDGDWDADDAATLYRQGGNSPLAKASSSPRQATSRAMAATMAPARIGTPMLRHCKRQICQSSQRLNANAAAKPASARPATSAQGSSPAGEPTSTTSRAATRTAEARESALRAARMRRQAEREDRQIEEAKRRQEKEKYQKRYKTAARKWVSSLIALPILLVTSYYLFDRREHA